MATTLNIIDSPAESRSVTYMEMVVILRRRWRLILYSVIACVTVMGLYCLSAQKIYQSTTRLLILQQGARPINVTSNDPARPSEGDDYFIPTQSQIISSPLVVQGAIDSVGLAKLPSLTKPSVVRKQRRPVDEAIECLRVSRPDRQAKVLVVDYWADSAEESEVMLKAITESYRQTLSDTYQKKSSETIQLIDRARADLTNELKEMEAKYVEFRRTMPVATGDESTRSLMAMRLERSSVALKEASDNARRLKFQLDLGKRLAEQGMELWAVAHAINQLGGDSSSLNAAVNSGLMLGLTTDYIRQLTAEQQELAERYGTSNARVREIQNMIVRIRESSKSSQGRMEKEEIRDLIRSIAQGLRTAEALRDEATSQFKAELAEAKETEIQMLSGANLEAQLERRRALYNTVLDQLKQAEFVSDMSSVVSQVLEIPRALPEPTWPRTKLMLFAAGLLGMVAGFVACVAADRMDQRIRSIKELRSILGVPYLGQVDFIEQRDQEHVNEIGLIVYEKPQSLVAECYRSVRTNLDFQRRSRTIGAVLVTSAYSGDGKSVSASNLAISRAQAGRKVLLIDGDLRRPSQGKIFGIENDRGLADVLGSHCTFREAVKPTLVENLDLLTAGQNVSNPAELLSTPRLEELLVQLRKDYDLVIIDSSPMLAVTDPTIIGSVTDGVILVARAGNVRRHETDLINEWSATLGSPILGLIVNATSKDSLTFGYGYGGYGRPKYGYGGYGYGYGGYGYGRAYGNGQAYGEAYGTVDNSSNSNGTGEDHVEKRNGVPTA